MDFFFDVVRALPWWWWLIAGVWFFFQAASLVDRVLSRLEWARRMHEDAMRPVAYYEEHNGAYAVFLWEDMHRALNERAHDASGWRFVVTPMMTFGPDSRMGYPQQFTGRIPDMVRLFAGWDLRHHNVGGACFAVPGSGFQNKEKVLLDGKPVVDMGKAWKIVRAEEEQCRKTRLTTGWYFWRNPFGW